jgi:hypothetical protein
MISCNHQPSPIGKKKVRIVSLMHDPPLIFGETCHLPRNHALYLLYGFGS